MAKIQARVTATITAQFAVVVGCGKAKVHGQQKALTVATNANENKIHVSSHITG